MTGIFSKLSQHAEKRQGLQKKVQLSFFADIKRYCNLHTLLMNHEHEKQIIFIQMPAKQGRLYYTTLQSMMNAKLSQKRVWCSNVIVLIKASRWVSSRLLILDEPILKVGLNLFLPKFGIARGLESYACLYAQGDFLWIFNRNCFFSSLRSFLRKYFFGC